MLNFLCIGAQKAGTSWLYQQLATHPDLCFPQGKEVHFWDHVQRGMRADDPQWYENCFAETDHRLRGDMTPAYAILEPRYIQRLHAMYPQARLLFILRDPVARAWSFARMTLARAQLDHDEVTPDWFAPVVFSRAAKARGDYETTLRRWRAVYNEEQLQVLFYEDIVTDPRGFLTTVATHLGVDPAPLLDREDTALQESVFPGPQISMPVGLRAQLQAHYREPVRALARYLDRDLSHWLT